ncbi:hypothetical protein F2P56_005430 [Juglans regia]|uniref:RNA-binding protein rsd1-like n=2 Tax=Juglans regia TaxID=51240 RepID=A0A2I4DWI0_JUGRE|nr:RNA-binding protein rsd1-like [Juglans regia]KAF5478908.1 hypothetical protein F2P56_005430 [Juglans regia]
MSDHLVGGFDLNFAVGKGNEIQDSIDDSLARSDDLKVDLSQHGKLGSPSLPVDFSYDKSSLENSYPVPAEFDPDDNRNTKFDCDQERTQSPVKNNYSQGEMDELNGNNLFNSSQFKAQKFHGEKGTKDSAHSQESPLMVEENPGEQMESDSGLGRPSICNEIEGGGGTNTAQLLPSPRSPWCKDEPKNGSLYHFKNSTAENKKLGMHSGMQSPKRMPRRSTSPVMERLMLVSPERSPYVHHSPNSQKASSSQQGFKDSSYSPRPQRHKHSSAERCSLNKVVQSQDHISSARETSTSPLISRHSYRRKDDSSQKGISASQKTSYSPPNYKRRDRSVSRSPIQRRDHKRDYHDRSLPRSPYSRTRYRSPRRRPSPRRRSPPLGYHLHHRTPKKRPWSPPRNRRTGAGLPGRNLFIAGFSFLTTERDLERKFSRFGRVRDVRIVRDKRSGDSRGFGFLSLERDEDADAAIRALDETEWNGRIILVEKSKS